MQILIVPLVRSNCANKKNALLAILWMDEILHHLRDPGRMIPL